MVLRNGTQNTRESILQWVQDATSSSCVQLLASTLYRQMSPDIQFSCRKRFYRAQQKQSFGVKVQDCKD